MNARGRTQFAPTAKRTENVKFLCPFLHVLQARYSVLHLISVLSGGNIAFLREEGGTRSVTEGARATLTLYKLYGNEFSLSRLRSQRPLGGSLFMFIYNLSIFLTSTAFADTKAKPRARRGEKSFQLFQNGFELIGISDSIKLFFRKPFVAENFAKRT